MAFTKTPDIKRLLLGGPLAPKKYKRKRDFPAPDLTKKPDGSDGPGQVVYCERNECFYVSNGKRWVKSNIGPDPKVLNAAVARVDEDLPG